MHRVVLLLSWRVAGFLGGLSGRTPPSPTGSLALTFTIALVALATTRTPQTREWRRIHLETTSTTLMSLRYHCRTTNPLRYSNLRSLSEEHCTLTCARIVQVPDFLTKFGDDRYRRSLGEHAPQRLRSTRCRARLLGHCQDQPWVSFLTTLWYHSSSSNRGLSAGLREATRYSSTSLLTRSPFSPVIPHVST